MSAPPQPRTARRPIKAQGKSRVTQYVDQQLEKTRRQVKSTDLVASILLLFVMVIGFLLLAAIVDAWVFTLTPLMRWAALLLLVTGCVVMMVFSIWPLLTKKINPDYAAKMLEDAKPGFRNSLLSYVWFRKKPDAIGGAVFDAVARQAAVDLNSVTDDSTVDRSKVIRLGFWLVGMTAAMIAYFMLSPKNPLQTINRVLFPSANLAKPAVVWISDVTPGSTMVFFGDQVEITAKVYGPHSPEQVQLIYSTNDGRQSGQVRVMQPDPTTPRQYKLNLTENTGGLRESLEYEIVARDGQSGKFQIKVAPRPAITIESVQIDPPKYTKLKSQTTLQGAVDGVEGAKVMVRATANLEIDEATIELLNQLPTLPNEDQKFKLARSPKKMAIDGKNAKATFQLQLDTNREKPFATHYRLDFRSIGGESPAVPNIYPIRIIPDLAPELEVRAPIDAESKVPANGTLNVAASANDVDYEISFLQIVVEHRGNQILNKEMPLKTQADNQRQAQARYVIRPEELGLATGDQAIFYITARDNRTTYFSDVEPSPNLTRSKNYSFTVVEPNISNEEHKNNSSEPNPATDENTPPEDSKDSKKEQSDSGDEGQPSKEGANKSQKKNESAEGGESKDQPSSNDANQQDPESNGSGDPESAQPKAGGESSESDPSAGSEGGDSETKDSDPEAGGTGGSEQAPDQQSTDGSGGSQTDADGGDPTNKGGGGSEQRPSDPDSNADATTAKSGNNPSGDNTVSDSAPERKDESLTEGEKQLSKEASEAEKVRQMEKFFSENPDKRQQEGDPDQSSDQEEGGGPQDPKTEEGADPPENKQQDSDDDASTDPGKREDEPNKSGNQSGSESDPQGKSDQQQSSSSQDPQKSNPKNDSSESKPSGDSAQQNSTKQNDPSSKSSSSDSDKPESGKPNSENKSGNPEKPSSNEKPGDEKSGESTKGQPGEKQTDDPSKSDDQSPAAEKSKGSPSGQTPQSKKPGGEPGREPSPGSPEGSPSDSTSGSGSGKPGGTAESSEVSDDEAPEGGDQAGAGDVGKDVLQREKENLKNAKKANDLLLDNLRSQRHNPDPELLKQMGWDKQDLNDYIDSWDQMRDAAEQGDARAQRRYERRIKSLGLIPDDQRRAVTNNGEDAGPLEIDGVVNEAPPNEFHDFNSFLQDLQRPRP